MLVAEEAALFEAESCDRRGLLH
ncbi:hypothetical protein ONE63_011208 [Megalurothrips usitatus]|uniref:Uncharacterized protein n=1 Tax=Megalurothrips usitatus TaxID=439358 RepID=A0AAV7X6A8_9NEOP|nr:hypothetical protein ONE63_011208 [Megalurothrips usitatus]